MVDLVFIPLSAYHCWVAVRKLQFHRFSWLAWSAAQVGVVQKFSEPNVVDGFLQRVCAAVGKPVGAPFVVVRPHSARSHCLSLLKLESTGITCE